MQNQNNNSFINGTVILVNSVISKKNIEDIQVGDEVLTYNTESFEQQTSTVGEIKSSTVESVIHIVFNNSLEIKCTEEHPFYVQDIGYVNAQNLEVGSICLGSDGVDAVVQSITSVSESFEVYTLSNIPLNQNFYANGVLVQAQ